MLHRFYHKSCRRNSRKHDNWKAEIVVPYFFECCNSVFARHHDVQNKESRRINAIGQRVDYLFSIFSKVNDEIRPAQRELEVIANLRFVFSYQDSEGRGRIACCAHTAAWEARAWLNER